MKKIKFMSLVAAMTILASCSNDNINGDVINGNDGENSDDGEKVSLTFTTGAGDSKTFLENKQLKWLPSDALGVFAVYAPAIDASTNPSTAAATFRAAFTRYTDNTQIYANFFAPDVNLPGAGKFTYCITYPYQASAKWGAGAKSTGCKVSDTQTQKVVNRTTDPTDAVSQYGYAINVIEGLWRSDRCPNLGELKPQVAYVELNLSALAKNYKNYKVQYATFEAYKTEDETKGVNIAGDFSIDWSKWKATTGMRAVTNVTNGKSKITLTPATPIIVPTSTSDSANIYMVALPTEVMDHFKISLYMKDPNGTTNFLFEAYGGRGDTKLQFAGGKKYKFTLPEDPNHDPVWFLYQEVYLFWGNDDTNDDNKVDVHGTNYTFNVNRARAVDADVWLRLPVGMIWNGDNSKLVQGNGTTGNPVILHLPKGILVDINVYLHPDLRNNPVEIGAYSSLADAQSGTNKIQNIPIIWKNRVGSQETAITEVKFDACDELNVDTRSSMQNGGYDANQSKLLDGYKLCDSWITSVANSNIKFVKNGYVQLNTNAIYSTKLRTNEADMVLSDGGIKKRVFIQQNEMCINSNSVYYSDGRYNLDGVGTKLVFGISSSSGVEAKSVTDPQLHWTTSDKYYKVTNVRTGAVSVYSGKNEESMVTSFEAFDEGDPCSMVSPMYNWRYVTYDELNILYSNSTHEKPYDKWEGTGMFAGITIETTPRMLLDYGTKASYRGFYWSGLHDYGGTVGVRQGYCSFVGNHTASANSMINFQWGIGQQGFKELTYQVGADSKQVILGAAVCIRN